MKLTSKQEKFSQNIASGKTQYESYLDAYPNSKKWKRKSVDEKASELMRNVKIVSRIEILKKPQQDVLEANRTKIIEKLVNIGIDNEKVYATTVTALSKLVDKLLPTKTETKNENKNTGLIHLVRDVKQARREVTRVEKKK